MGASRSTTTSETTTGLNPAAIRLKRDRSESIPDTAWEEQPAFDILRPLIDLSSQIIEPFVSNIVSPITRNSPFLAGLTNLMTAPLNISPLPIDTLTPQPIDDNDDDTTIIPEPELNDDTDVDSNRVDRSQTPEEEPELNRIYKTKDSKENEYENWDGIMYEW